MSTTAYKQLNRNKTKLMNEEIRRVVSENQVNCILLLNNNNSSHRIGASIPFVISLTAMSVIVSNYQKCQMSDRNNISHSLSAVLPRCGSIECNAKEDPKEQATSMPISTNQVNRKQ